MLIINKYDISSYVSPNRDIKSDYKGRLNTKEGQKLLWALNHAGQIGWHTCTQIAFDKNGLGGF